MQSKTTVRYHLTSVRLAGIKEIGYKCLEGFGKTGSLITLTGNINCLASMEKGMEVILRRWDWEIIQCSRTQAVYLPEMNILPCIDISPGCDLNASAIEWTA